MTTQARAAQAHRAAFALITAALTNPETFDAETLIADFALDSENPGQAVTDIAHVLVWHAASALLVYTEGDIPEALKFVQKGALMQETHDD